MKYFNLHYNRGFKTGINPNERMNYILTNLTPTQKLTLTACRIFNTTIGDGYKNGRKFISQSKLENTRLTDYYHFVNVKEANPYLEEYPDRDEWKKLKFERRKQRILMRGVKIGNKKSSASSGSFDLFSQKKSGVVSTGNPGI